MTIDLNLVGTVLGIILTFLGVIGLLGGWLNALGLKPIKDVLYAIKEELTTLNKEIEDSKLDRRNLALEIAKVAESVRSAQHRIDEMREECRSNHAGKV